jgi:TPR repeat protein
MFFGGRGVAQNYVDAHKWCEMAAELGESSAQRNLSLIYENGYGVTRDPEKAQYWNSKFLEHIKQ